MLSIVTFPVVLSFCNICSIDNVKEYRTYKIIEGLTKNIYVNEDYICNLSKIIVKNSEKYNINYETLIAIIYIESSFIYIIGDDGNSYGLMQVNQKYWKKYVEEKGYKMNDLFNPEIGIEIGTEILSKLIKKYGLYKGIEKYNGSKEYVEKYKKTKGRIKKFKF